VSETTRWALPFLLSNRVLLRLLFSWVLGVFVIYTGLNSKLSWMREISVHPLPIETQTLIELDSSIAEESTLYFNDQLLTVVEGSSKRQAVLPCAHLSDLCAKPLHLTLLETRSVIAWVHWLKVNVNA